MSGTVTAGHAAVAAPDDLFVIWVNQHGGIPSPAWVVADDERTPEWTRAEVHALHMIAVPMGALEPQLAARATAPDVNSGTGRLSTIGASPSPSPPGSGNPDLNVGMEISVQKLDKELPTPSRAHQDDAGLDLYSAETHTLTPGARAAIPTGLAVALPPGHAGLVTPRSGLAIRHGISIVNSPGLIDAGYRGEIKVVLVNQGDQSVTVRRGDRIAQLVVIEVSMVTPVVVDNLDGTDRGVAGFGSTGA